MLDVQGVILAGGKGTRLRPITSDLPKPLVPLANRPLVEHQLAHLARCGIRDVTLALGYNAARFETVLEDADRLGLRVNLVAEPRPLGTGGALRYCADQGAFDERPLLWMNGDVVASPSVEAMADFHTGRGACLTLWLTSARDVTQFGVIELEPDGRVGRFLEKPAPEESDSHLVNAGIVMLDPALLQRIPADTFFSFEKELLPGMVSRREGVYGLFDGGYWLDIGRPPFFRLANRHVLEGRVDWQPAGEETEAGLWEGKDVQRNAVSVIQPAALGDGVVLEDGAQLFGRTVIGRNVHIGEGAELEACVVFDDVVVGAGSEIINSVVCAGARIGEGVILDDAIVGARSVVGDRNELRGARLWNDVQLSAGVLVVD